MYITTGFTVLLPRVEKTVLTCTNPDCVNKNHAVNGKFCNSCGQPPTAKTELRDEDYWSAFDKLKSKEVRVNHHRDDYSKNFWVWIPDATFKRSKGTFKEVYPLPPTITPNPDALNELESSLKAAGFREITRCLFLVSGKDADFS